ncbi:hypothetical protein D3C72_2052230 [compost metagenome]
MMSDIAGAVPLWGTNVMLLFRALWSSSPQRCEADPTPAFARFSLPPFSVMNLRSSGKPLGGRSGLPISVEGASLISPRNSRSEVL